MFSENDDTYCYHVNEYVERREKKNRTYLPFLLSNFCLVASVLKVEYHHLIIIVSVVHVHVHDLVFIHVHQVYVHERQQRPLIEHHRKVMMKICQRSMSMIFELNIYLNQILFNQQWVKNIVIIYNKWPIFRINNVSMNSRYHSLVKMIMLYRTILVKCRQHHLKKHFYSTKSTNYVCVCVLKRKQTESTGVVIDIYSFFCT